MNIKHIDCTLRDGGYYNDWDFSEELVRDYLTAMAESGVDYVELGFRFWKNEGFKGPYAFSKDDFFDSMDLPPKLKYGVMLNAADAIQDGALDWQRIKKLFPRHAEESKINLVRVACHYHEFETILPLSGWLKDRGYVVGYNLMQIADRTREEVVSIAKVAHQGQLDCLYFADSLGSMLNEDTKRIVSWIQEGWSGEIGIHTHDNLGLALSNTKTAIDCGITWVDSTVTGMGRGPGNARTEELAIELAGMRNVNLNLVPLMKLIKKHFKPMKEFHGWGTNPFYYLAGKHGIHPTYIQEMLGDSRYDEEDVLAVIEHLRLEGGKKFSLHTLDAARNFYKGSPKGSWNPRILFQDREVLLLGTGPGVKNHKTAIEHYIRKEKPLVVALNTQTEVAAELIDVRVACHPVRLLADCEEHTRLPQPLITPYSMLPEDVRLALKEKVIYDFGLNVVPGEYGFSETWCTVPTSLVVSYALAIATSGMAKQILMAGFDGYGADDPRSMEMQSIIDIYNINELAIPMISLTNTRYHLQLKSLYGL